MKYINKKNLEKNKIYFIECLKYDKNNNLIKNDYDGKCIGIFSHYVNYSSKNNYDYILFHHFQKIDDSEKISYARYIDWNFPCKFYEIEKEKIQYNMEKRAFILILEKVVGDTYFAKSQLFY